MFKTFLQFTSLIVVLLSSYFLVKGVLEMTPKNILDLSGTYLDSNPFAVKSLCAQRADSIVGTVLLLLSFFLQLWVVSLPVYFDDSVNLKGVILAFIVSIIFCLISLGVSKSLSNYFYQQVIEIEKKERK